MQTHTRDDYFYALAALLPPGAALPRTRDSRLGQLLYALTAELARHDARCADLLNESDPRTATELFAEWEAWAGLPSPCLASETLTLGQRRALLIDKLTDPGGQRPQDYIDMAARFGHTITIREHVYTPWTVTTPINKSIFGCSWRLVWIVDMPSSGLGFLECLIRSRAPEHTSVLFTHP
jgi:uncharacterized protein YmfQ (DUF2313 family)